MNLLSWKVKPIRAVYRSFGLELIESTASDSIVDRFIKRRGERGYGIVIKMSEREESVKDFQVQEKGIRTTGEITI